MTRPRVRRHAAVGMLFAVIVAWWLAAPPQLGGQTAYVTTQGVSMAPRFHTGDLAIVHAKDRYEVGDVVAYRSRELKTTVMHRIVAETAGRYTFKGDNNDWLDPERPSRGDLVGELLLRVPQGGIWIRRLTNPTTLGALTFVLFITGSAAATKRRSRRRRAMSQHATRSRLPAPLAAAALLTAAMGVLGASAGALVWTRPVTTSEARTSSAVMRFSYTAEVGHSAAYDTASISAPNPVFRKLAQTVDVRYSYTGQPGTVSVSALLSTSSGWYATVPLAPARRFSGMHLEGSVRLDLRALDARAQAAATVIGIPAGLIKIVVTPQVQALDGTSFQPTLNLNLTPLQLSPAEGPLTVTSKSVAPDASTVSAKLGWHGRHLSVVQARVASLALVIASLLIGAGLLLIGRRSASNESEAIRRRYRPLLARVHPMPMTGDHPVIDVTEFATLARIAERDGHPVLHWSRSGVDTYIVQDAGCTYRYRTGQSSTPLTPHSLAAWPSES